MGVPYMTGLHARSVFSLSPALRMEQQPDRLCDVCQIPGQEWPDVAKPFEDMYPEFPKLKAAEEKGCDTCKLLRHALLHRYNDEAVAEASVDFGYPPGTARPSWDHRVTLTPEGRLGRRELWWTPSPYPPPNSRAGDPIGLNLKIRARPPTKEVLSPENMRLIFRWLDSCDANHTSCEHQRLPRLPTRVIDVGSTGGSEVIRLIESGNIPGNYVVLSHCWGSGTNGAIRNESKLLQGNMESLQRGIDFKSLANNFKDAITATKKLQIRYLWIDALCIIQDSPSDWARESAHMDEIYANSYLTLAATSAKTSSDGFLKDYDSPVAIRSWKSPKDPTIDGKYYLTYRHSVLNTWQYIEDKTLWATRGWIFQERLMSRRILHFLPDFELAWECRTEDDSQNLSHKDRSPKDRGYWILTKEKDPRISKPVPGFDATYERWYWITSNYSPRNFTYDTDRLPALSGLARVFKELYVPEDQYTAGLWRKDLIHGLLWMVRECEAASRPSSYCAPSWSWASVQGSEITWPTRTIPMHCHKTYAVELLDVITVPATENPMGLVTSGTVTLLGRIRQISHAARPAEPDCNFRFPMNLFCNKQQIGNGDFDTAADKGGQDIWMLQIIEQQQFYCFIPYHPTALLLSRSQGSNTFQRVGYAILEDENLDFFNCEPKEITIV
ncbi:MAG: hypothetical protein Q9203_001387 [Teloschistes exilis]